MAHSVSAQAATTAPTGRRRAVIHKALIAAAAVAVAAALLGTFSYLHRSPTDLGSGHNAVSQGLLSHWQAGDVIMLVRHAERCDRSSNTCLGPADGITQLGSETSTTVGQALKTLGMGHADVLTSPTTRTAQTAQYMFGQGIAAPEWLANCDTSLLQNAIAHKVPERNLVTVTHSGCIGHVEKQLGYPHAAGAEYNSALVLTLDEHGKAVILGVINADAWPKTLVQLQLSAKQNNL